MIKHIKFPSIEQFKNIVKQVQLQSAYEGKDELGNPIYNELKPKPILTFKGTVKLHGTNAGICYNNVEGLWIQSRENIITPLKDNAGFATFIESKKHTLIPYIKNFSIENNIDLDLNTISIYFEWVGKGIQKGVSISEIEKSAFVIGIKITPFDETKSAYWIDSKTFKLISDRIYNIEDYKTFEVEIDFNNPLLSQNKIIDLTLEVEEECPVAKEFGFSGIGEGIVFSYINENKEKLCFKSKGELHSKSKVKTLKEVDDNKINKIQEIAEKVTPSWRLEQMLQQTFDLLNGGSVDIKKTGEFIKNMMQDIIKEDLDILTENGLEPKDIGGKVAEISRKYLFENL
jgi:hypothetical protein